MGKALSQKDADAIRANVKSGMADMDAIDAHLDSSALNLRNAPAGSPGVYQPATNVAEEYAKSAGINYTPTDTYADLDEDRAAAIADEFELMEHAPQDPVVKEAYQALIDEVVEQYRFVIDSGLKVEIITGEDPYTSGPNELLDDVRYNNHLWVYPTADGFGSDSTFDVSQNPLLQETEFDVDGHKLLANDVFRIVHDYFGHVAQGAGFRARGEEAAWQAHAAMFSPQARRALTTETRGQNSWLNFGPHGESNRTAVTEDTVFADQKIGLMPMWVSEEGRLSAHERRQRFERNIRAGTSGFEGAIDPTGRVELIHYSEHQLERVDPSRWGQGLSRFVRSEASRRNEAPGRVFFGIESANEHPYRKESGLGNRRLVAQLPGELIYDYRADPENLRTQHDPAASERAVADAGYMGYWVDDPSIGKVVAVFDEVNVSPEVVTLAQSPIPKGRVAVGDFTGKEYADGTLIVYGDIESIRAKLPEGVRGTPVQTPKGLRFTPNMAHRAAAGLRGDPVTYSRGGKVIRTKKDKNGKYVGASESNNTPSKRTTWRKKFRQLAEEGAPGRFWYENSGSEIYNMTGGNMDEAKKFIALLAIYSPQAKVDANSTFALRAWAQYKAGIPIEVKTGSQDRQATDILYNGAAWGGEKTNNFYANLLRQVDPAHSKGQGATIDMWMMRAGFYDHDAPNTSEYAFMENETNLLAEEMGWEPQQVQAAVWVGMKARMENEEVKRVTEQVSRKNKWIKGGGIGRKILDQSKHAMNWVNQGMKHSLTAKDTQLAKFDFSDGVRRHIGQISSESVPTTHSDILAGIHAATYEQKMELHLAIQEALSDDTGADMLAQQLGILADGSVIAPGVWGGETNPSTQLKVAVAPAGGGIMHTNNEGDVITDRAFKALKESEQVEWFARGPRIPYTSKTDIGPMYPDMEYQRYHATASIDPAQAQVLDVYAAILGLLTRQDGVGYHKAFYKNSVKQSNAVEFDLGRVMTPEEAHALDVILMEELNHEATGIISTPAGVRVVNLDESVDNKKFHKIVTKALEAVTPDGLEFEPVYFASDGKIVMNNWKENKNGEGYQGQVIDAGRSDILRWSASVLYPKTQSVYEEFAERYDWGDVPPIKFTPETPQELAQDNRATIEIRGNERQIRLGKESDLSSFLHESAHMFLELERQLAADFGVTPNQRAMLDWLGVDTFGDITVDLHEKYAETFEVYVETGKAPSLALREAFAAFRRWLTAIYKSMDNRTRADLTPEIIEYFDRMLATDAEIEQAAGNPVFEELFRSKEQAGMTDEDWAKYKKQQQRVTDTATATLDEKLISELTNRAGERWREEKAPLIEQEKERLRKEPVYQVLTNLASEPMDYDAVVELNGGKVPGKMIGKAKKGGIHPDMYAEAHGFASAGQMIKAINEAPTLNKAAEEAAEAIMVDKHGDILNDGSIAQEAREAMHNNEHAKLLLMELKALDKTTKINREYLKAEAKRMISTMKFKEIKPGKFERAATRAAIEAATAKTDEEKFAATSKRLANHYLFKEATKVRDDMQRQRKYVRKAATRTYNPKAVEPSFIANIKAIANMYDMRANTERVQDMNAVINWYTTQLLDENQYVDIALLDLNIIRAVAAKNESTNNQIPADFKLPQFDDLTAEDLASVYDQLRHLRFVGGAQSEEASELKVVKRGILSEAIIENGGKDQKNQRGIPGKHESTARAISHFFNSLSSLRNIARKMDNEWGGNDGAVYEMVFAPIEQASNKLMELKHGMYAVYQDKLSDLHNAGLKRTDKKSYTLESGLTLDMHSEGRFMMALYWGTETSREAIMQGFGVTANDVNKILADMTPTQVSLVNATWQVNETLWPELSKTSTTLYGVAPAQLDPVPFEINGTPMTGGHMRLFYDSSEIELKTEQASNGSQSNVMPNKAGSLHSRVGSGGRPPSLDASNIIVSLDEAMHFIAFAETANDLHGLIDSPDVKGAIERKHGPGMYKSFIDNVDNKTGNRSARETVPGLAKLARLGRRSVTMAYLAFSVKNTVESVSALPLAMDEVGPVRFMANAAKIYSAMLEPGNNFTEDMILSRSSYMRDRGQFVSRESSEFVNQMTSTGQIDHAWKKFQAMGFTPQIMADKMFSYPVWMSAYERAMEDPNMTETKAVSIADSSVAESVGSGSDLHMGGMLASNQTQWVKLFTAFNSWFNMVYQRMYKSTKGGTDFFTKEALTGVMLAPMAAAFLTAMVTGRGPDEDDDEGWVEFTLNEYFLFIGAAAPVIRDLANLIATGMGSSGTMASRPGESLVAAPTALADLFMDDDKSTEKKISNVLKAVGGITPLPASGNITRLLDFVDENGGWPENGWEAYTALTQGKKAAQ